MKFWKFENLNIKENVKEKGINENVVQKGITLVGKGVSERG